MFPLYLSNKGVYILYRKRNFCKIQKKTFAMEFFLSKVGDVGYNFAGKDATSGFASTPDECLRKISFLFEKVTISSAVEARTHTLTILWRRGEEKHLLTLQQHVTFLKVTAPC